MVAAPAAAAIGRPRGRLFDQMAELAEATAAQAIRPFEVVGLRDVGYRPRGAAAAVQTNTDRECLLDGPAGTGKTLAALWKLHLAARNHPGMRGLILRKTHTSLTATALVTFRERVLAVDSFGARFFHGSAEEPPAYRYPNGSRLVVGGLDDAERTQKIMSSEYDLIYPNEATELGEAEWESLTTRLRHYVMPYQQLLGDCNPGPPNHWLNRRCDAGATTRLTSRHEDNPMLWDAGRGDWTPQGREYIARLDALTGVRLLRLRHGKWVAAEGQVYDAWDDAVHVIDRGELPPDRSLQHIAGVDWGWTNPGVIGVWAIDGDGRMYLVAEHYHTRKPVDSWWIPRAQELSRRYRIGEWFCDPSEPAYIAQFQTAGLDAGPATNDILPGITAVWDRLAPAGDGRPRLFVVRDCLLERDESLVAAGLPWCTAQEVGAYTWPKDESGRVRKKEKPIDAYNHGMDQMRYAVASRDLRDDSLTPADPYLLSHFVGYPGLSDADAY